MENPNQEVFSNLERDRLSDLPEAVLHRILSRLEDTKYAVQTSVLSKRWRHLWTAVEDLNFNGKSFTNQKSFEGFVDAILGRDDNNYNINRFCFTAFSESNTYRENSDIAAADLVKYAGARGVRHLMLHLTGMPPLPREVFACRTLKTLHLKFVWLDFHDMRGLSSTVTSLCLDSCVLLGGCFDILALFPNLTDLSLVSYRRLGYDRLIKVSGPGLLSLRIDEGKAPDPHQLELLLPNLVSFECFSSSGVMNFSDIYLPSLRHAYLNFHACWVDALLSTQKYGEITVNDWCRKFGYTLLKLLQGLCNVEFLTINTKPLKYLDKSGILENQEMQRPSFGKLKSLKFRDADNDDGVPQGIKTYLIGRIPHPENTNIEFLRR